MSKGKVVVIGQGYVGLPVAIRACNAGYDVQGLEVDEDKINSLLRGRSYVEDITDNDLQSALSSDRYNVSRDYATAEGFDYAVISVPTPLRDSLPDLSFIEYSAQGISQYIRPGSTVILESTTYPGTTEELLVPLLEAGSSLVAGRDFFVGYSPERIDPGNAKWGFVETPKVVSGLGPSSLVRVKRFYDDLVETTVEVSGTKEAELTKLLENTFRHVNIALVNELAVFADQLGVNIWEAIEAADSKPFGYMKFTPGPGVGGHCLPVDPSYLSWQVKRQLGKNFRFVELANDVNDHMPNYVVERCISILNRHKKAMNGSTIMLMGISYKRNTGDIRESPALKLIELLCSFGANVQAIDSHVPESVWPVAVDRVSATDIDYPSIDLAVLLTDHDDMDYDSVAGRGIPVFDTRNRVSAGPSVFYL